MKLTEENARELVSLALKARESSYCPYSGFAVGAALLCADGSVYTGCNIEVAALTGSCAERTAIFNAVSEGRRDFAAIAVAGAGKGQDPDFFCTPCGVCRQVMREFCKPDFEVIMTDGRDIKAATFEELLPMAFGPDDLA